jgi:hypothetical protein
MNRLNKESVYKAGVDMGEGGGGGFGKGVATTNTYLIKVWAHISWYDLLQIHRGNIQYLHHFGNLDPHPHQIKSRIRIKIYKLDPDPDLFADVKPKCQIRIRIK